MRLPEEEVLIWEVIKIRVSRKGFKSWLKMRGILDLRAKGRVLLRRVSKEKRFLNKKRFNWNKLRVLLLWS